MCHPIIVFTSQSVDADCAGLPATHPEYLCLIETNPVFSARTPRTFLPKQNRQTLHFASHHQHQLLFYSKKKK